MNESKVYEFGFLADGHWHDDGPNSIETFDPARPSQLVGRYSTTLASDVGSIVASAGRAQEAWGELPLVERGRIIARFLDAVESRTEDIARAITREQGKPLGEARGEIGKSLREARFIAGEASRPAGEVFASQRAGVRNLVLHRPRGVIAAITPWNFPVLTPMRKIAPALTYGNALVIKPSEFTPAAMAIIAEMSRDILPDGVLQMILGGSDVGATLVGNSGVDGVTFTGSVPTGRQIYAAAAENLTEVSLELGGKNAAVINDTDNLDGCLDQIVGAANQCAGQRCTAISRVIVHESLKQQVLEGLVSRSRAERLGPGDVEGVTMGPLIHGEQLARVEGYVRQAREAGATIATGGQRASIANAPDGFFFEPTVVSEVTADMAVARQEIFGPVLTVQSYQTVEEAFEILNGVEFGLTSALFSNDNRLVQQFLDRSQSGMLHVNHGTTPDDHMPFGGIGNSGVGAYSVGASSARFYTTEHSAYVKYE